jgi:hypothetical protein
MRGDIMNAITFASAYRQLRPVEKAYVDGYVATVERDYVSRGERISNALYRAIPGDVVEASRGMLDKPMVLAAITERINSLAADSELSPHRVIKELMSLAFSSIEHYQAIGEDGMPYYDLSKATPEQLAAIQAVEFEETMTRSGPQRKLKIKLHDKLGGLDRLLRYMGLQEPDNPHWRSETARPVGAGALPAAMTVDGAADAYARMING